MKRFEEVLAGWHNSRLSQSEAALLLGVCETIARHGLFCSLYTDRSSHYFHTPEAGGKVDRSNPTQFGRAFGTHQ